MDSETDTRLEGDEPGSLRAILLKLDELVEAVRSNDQELLSCLQVAHMLGVSPSAFRRIERGDKSFPSPVQVLGRIVMWRRADVIRWIQRRPEKPRRERLNPR